MHHKFINLCGHQLLLSFASSVIIVFFITSNVLAEWVSSEGRYFIDRKTTESRDIVQFELVGALDQANKKLPARQVTRNDFPGVGTFINT